jgi:uncharacterized protein (TIGR00369 family)
MTKQDLQVPGWREEWEELPDNGFMAHVGPVWRHRESGSGRYAVLADERHRNWRGVVQGGMVMTLADRAMGSAARQDDPDVKQATAQLDVNFVAPAGIGMPLEASCEVVARTRSLVFMRSILMQENRIVATASGVWKVFRPRPEGKATPAPALPESSMHGWVEEIDDGFLDHVGPLWRCRDAAHRYGFVADERHRNRRGVVQGGMLMTLADRGMGGAARGDDPEMAPATIQLNMNFVAAARIGGLVEVDCSIVRRTRTMVFVQAILSQGESVIATATGIWRPLLRSY